MNTSKNIRLLLAVTALLSLLCNISGATVKLNQKQEGTFKEARLIVPKENNTGSPLDPNIKSELELKLLESFGGFTSLEGVGGWESGNGQNKTGPLVVHHEPVWIYDIACFDNPETETILIGFATWVKSAANQLSVYLRLPSGKVMFV